jgi:hypothetical protein
MNDSQKRAIQNYRSRLEERGLARFEILGRNRDKEMIRALAKRLAEGGPEAARIGAAVTLAIAEKPTKKAGVADALRDFPFDGIELDIEPRPRGKVREIDL